MGNRGKKNKKIKQNDPRKVCTLTSVSRHQ